MPTENEYKFVISLDIERDVYNASVKVENVSQGYLTEDGSVRLRQVAMKPNILTYKRNVGSRIVEIETEVDDKDFHDLWVLTTGKLTKIRYYLPEHGWTVDFIVGAGNKPVLAIAEVELPEDISFSMIPKVLRGYVRYTVEQGDPRFFNSKFGDEQYVLDLAKEFYK